MHSVFGYQITELLYESKNSLVYRGLRPVDHKSVVLKLLRDEQPSPETIAWFKREFERTRKLYSAPGMEKGGNGIIEAYALETFDHRWVMVLEDFGGESLNRLRYAGALSLRDFLTLAIGITGILGKIHQQRVIHKDINPSNIVFNQASGQIKLIDFGISTELAHEYPTFRNAKGLEGTIAYLSPEQTGRMNRAIDYRTDFYSLGVTFYELLTGQLPFQNQDMLELVHCHIAQQPTPPHLIKAEIPLALSQIILKLMAKNAEDRYQSAYGIKADLLACLQQWQATEQLTVFPLAAEDVIDQFQISQKLYGREEETQRLLAAFDRISQGGSELILVAGYPGIGKSALVQEVYKPITRQHGYFITGKFDQFQRDIPYASLVQAIRALIRELLSESEAAIAVWRQAILATLGLNAQVIIQVIPELELVLGPQPPVPDLLPTEAQNRFNRTFQHFIQIFSQPEHPLVIFLDDLQWSDGASLKLLQSLLLAENSQYLLFIGAYRDNEVTATHPLMLTVDEIKKAGIRVNEFVLSVLNEHHAAQLMADTLRCPRESVMSLVNLLLSKTSGNPFFLNEFVKALYREGFITFDYTHNQWQWELAQIQARDITDNVVELMADKIQKLPAQTQVALQLAACVGNKFDLATLAGICEKSPQQVAHDLWSALAEGLLMPLNDTYKLLEVEVEGLTERMTVGYKFVHDRIQQATYSLIPEADRPALHLRIGRLLQQRLPADQQAGRIFDIVNQLNWGHSLLGQQVERDELANLNLLAGRKAKAAAAYQPALNYLNTSLDLVGASATAPAGDSASWSRNYALTLLLHMEAAELASVIGDYAQMNQLIDRLLQHAQSDLDRARAYEILLNAHYAREDAPAAMQIGREALKLLGIEFPAAPGWPEIMNAIQAVQATLAKQPLSNLVNLPAMSDPVQLTTIHIMNSLDSVAWNLDINLRVLLICKQLSLLLDHGNSLEAPFVYANFGVVLTIMQDFDQGYQFGALAFELLERFNALKYKAKTYFISVYIIRHWKESYRNLLPYLLEALQSGIETGDLEYAATIASGYGQMLFLSGQNLTEVEQAMTKYGQAIVQFKQKAPLQWHQIYWQGILNLLDRSENPCRIHGEVLHEEEGLQGYLEAKHYGALFHLYTWKLYLCYLFQQPQSMLEYVTEMEKYAFVAEGAPVAPAATFYGLLARLFCFSEIPTSEREALLAKVNTHQEKMKLWAQHAPMNYLHKFYLVEAERARVLGQDSAARDYYDQAIDLAIANEYLNEEALAYELAGRFYLAKGQTRVAHQYLRDAYYAYQRWGAAAKVRDLEQRYPHLLLRPTAPSLRTSTTTTTGQSAALLDLTSVLKASQAISGEIQLDKLLDKLMKIVIENAGAQQGFLLLERKGQWWIEAAGVIEQGTSAAPGTPEITTQQATPALESNRLATTIVNYVRRTREPVVLDDASGSSRFAQDPYIQRTQPKSVLCTPLLNQGKLTAMLYLENNLTTNAFTQERLEVLNLLSAQAAISLENARLYSHQVALTNGYSRFVPQEILRFLQKESIVDVKLGDQVQQEMAILVSDVRSFTTLSETMTPQENFDFVNAYLGRVSPIVRQHGGLIVKYMGDGMMAVFPTRAEDALLAALDKLRAVELYNDVRRAHGYVPLQIGIGIHTGTMMLGTVGEPERMQSDLLSDAVNLTARLEGLAKEYGAALIISQEFLQRLPNPASYQMRFLGKAQVKGRQALVTIYEIFDADSPEQAAGKAATKADFEAALTLFFDQRFAEAYSLFQRVLQHNPQDKAAALYVQRVILALQPPAPLNPVEIASRPAG